MDLYLHKVLVDAVYSNRFGREKDRADNITRDSLLVYTVYI